MTRVAICKGSLLLETIAQSLRAIPGFEVLLVDPTRPDALAQITAGRVDVVLLEHATVPTASDNLLLALLHDHPALPLIGLDPGRSVLTVLSSRQQPAGRLADLVEMIGRMKAQKGG